MPRGHEQYPIYSHLYLCGLLGPIFLQVFLEKDCYGKKKLLCCVNDHLFAQKYTLKFSLFVEKCA